MADTDLVENINGCCLEYYADEHMYLVDGVQLPSITQVVRTRFKTKYSHVSRAVLNRAAQRGTAVHEAIENYCIAERAGETVEDDCTELRNFKFLKKKFGFEVIENEVPIILFKDDVPVCAGRLDLVLKEGDKLGLGDIKRTSTLDKNYLGYQLNLYRIAYQQCYGKEIEFLRGLHLREVVRKYVNIPVNEPIAWDLVNEFLGG